MTMVQEFSHQEQRMRMGYAEFLTQIDEHAHAEWVKGKVIIFMPPNAKHQRIVSFLSSLLSAFVRFFQ